MVRIPGLGMLPPGSSVARDDGLMGCHERAPGCLCVVRHFVRAIVSSGPEVVEFKDGPQLGSGRRGETKGLILSHLQFDHGCLLLKMNDPSQLVGSCSLDIQTTSGHLVRLDKVFSFLLLQYREQGETH